MPTLNGEPNGQSAPVFDPQLLDASSNWSAADLAPDAPQFTFIPQGGDMMCVVR